MGRRMTRLTKLIALTICLATIRHASAQTGACCSDVNDSCAVGVLAADCASPNDRFIENGTCDDFSPACGQGICCTPSGCLESTRVACIVNPDGYFWFPARFCNGLDCTDCDGNFRPDAFEIEMDPSLDCNGNGILDRCEIDAGSIAPNGPYFCTTGDCAPDCNDNGIPDECEIYEFSSAPGGPYYCQSGCNPDCNNNGVPDECDIDPTDPDGNGDVSDDVLIPLGVPDECRRWTGAVNDLWSEPDNWLPPSVPNNTMTDRFSVVIDGSIDAPSANVEADMNIEIDALVLRDNSVLTLTLGDLTIAGIDGIVDEGLILIPDDRALHADASFRIRGNGGAIQLAGENATISSTPPDAIITNEIAIQGRGNITANLRNAAIASITADDAGPSDTGTLEISGETTLNNGSLVARSRATLWITTDVSEEAGGMSSISAFGANVKVGDGGDEGDDPEGIDGCGPIILRPTELTKFTLDRGELRNFTRWEIGDNSLTLPNQLATFEVLNGSVGLVMGPINVRNNGTLLVDASTVDAETYFLDGGATFSASDGAALTVRGNFVISGNDETRFDFAQDTSLVFEGGDVNCGNTQWDRTLEAAGRNFGPGLNDGGYDNNFDFAELRIAANANAELVDNIDNGNRPLDGSEAVYCDTLVLENNATLFLNGIALFAGGQQIAAGPFGGGEVVERQACCLPNATCTMEIPDCCTGLSGTPLGNGSQCSSSAGSACPPVGACCLADATCIASTPAVCIAQSGDYRGDDTSCGAIDCASSPISQIPTGACCINDGACNVTTEADCTNGGATYRGDDSLCADAGCSLPAPSPTTPPVGACCMTNLTCVDLTAADCTAANGEFFGSNSNCGTTNCLAIQPPGPQTAPEVNLLDEAICRLFKQSLCGIPGCAPCGAMSFIVTLIGIRRMRRRRRR